MQVIYLHVEFLAAAQRNVKHDVEPNLYLTNLI